MTKKPRLREIEILRGMAFAAVVLQHSIAHFSVVPELKMEDGARLTLLLLAAKFAVPAFIFITGLVLFYNYEGKINYVSFVRKRFKDIIVPYLLWSVIYSFMVGIYNHPLWESITTMIRFWLTGKSSYHLWYIVMIIPMYLLFPPLRIAVRKIVTWVNGQRKRAWLLMIGLIAGYELILFARPLITDTATSLHIPVISAYFTTYADRNVIYYLFYFLLGALAGLHINVFLDILKRVKFPVIVICGLFAVYYTGLVLGHFPPEAPFGRRFIALTLLQPAMGLFLIAFLALIYIVALSIQSNGSTVHRQLWITLSRYSYGGYLAHALMLRISYIIEESLLAGMNITIRMLLVWIITLVLSVLATYVISYIPYGHWLTGMSLRKKREVKTS